MIRRIRRPPRSPMSSVTRIKEQKRTIVDRHIEADNVRGFAQVLATLAPLAALWYAAALSAGVSYWLTAAVTLAMSLFVLRAFLLMHDCGHGSLFRTARLNKAFGFIFGVVWGMGAYVVDLRTRAVFCRVRSRHFVGRSSGARAVYGAA